MTLIKSISGIRGTIGGSPGDNLTPEDIIRFSSAFAEFIKRRSGQERVRIVVGRDARISGEMVNLLVAGALISLGVDVIDGGLLTTPTVEMAVTFLKANGGIVITASHNPLNWNALKLLNEKGEFISGEEGKTVLSIAETHAYSYVTVEELGKYSRHHGLTDLHIDSILDLPLIDIDVIRQAGFKIAIDCINSVGGYALPRLLEKLGVETIEMIHCEPDGNFAHNPEPLPENLRDLALFIRENDIDMGFAVDPDVDRLAIVTEKGEMFGEEYTLVAVADYVLRNKPGCAVSNLSSTRALQDIAVQRGGSYCASAVGEVNVVEMMKKKNAVIGGEGNGGVIYPELHYGRDALVGIALFLSYLAQASVSVSELRKRFPDYHIAKKKMELPPETDIKQLFDTLKEKMTDLNINTTDGIKIDLDNEWVHLRPSNTEPIIRIYSESTDAEKANRLAEKYMNLIKEVFSKPL